MDNGGHCSDSRPGIWNRPFAPISVNFPCQLGTLGSVHDYIVSELGITTPGSQPDFVEKLALLPHYHFTEHRHLFHPLKVNGVQGVFTIAHLNKAYKLSPEVLTVITGATFRIPSSVVVYFSKPRESFTFVERNLGRELRSRGMPLSCLRWKERNNNKELHIQDTGRADLFVDTFQA